MVMSGPLFVSRNMRLSSRYAGRLLDLGCRIWACVSYLDCRCRARYADCSVRDLVQKSKTVHGTHFTNGMAPRPSDITPHHAVKRSGPPDADKETLNGGQQQVVCSESQTKSPQVGGTPRQGPSIAAGISCAACTRSGFIGRTDTAPTQHA
jgi:hypothetical protein